MAEPVQTLAFTRRRLPHWLVANHAYFVTLCRKGCLPARVLEELREERAEMAARKEAAGVRLVAPDVQHGPGVVRLVAPDVPAGATQYDRRYEPVDHGDSAHKQDVALTAQRRRFLKLEAILDAAARSERDLCEPAASRIILGNLNWLRGRGWRVWAATLMPSHVHLVMANAAGRGDALREHLAQFMSFAGRSVNAAKGTLGGFWQREPFDHWCRDSDAWLRSVTYTVNNPVKAGFSAAWRDWPHTVVDPEVEAVLSESDGS